ncbi:MAG: UDP-N-acetylglucosamine 1-carboxyvinyltransferase [Acidimicrobiales bacterium]
MPPSTNAEPNLIVRGGRPLEGTIRVGGAKNSALKLMAATLLAEGTYRLANVPRITDVGLMSELLRATGALVGWDETGDEPVLVIDVPAVITPVAPYELVEQFRASIVVLGPMLARCGEARVALPGGDDFGPRPIDMHVRGLAELGAEFETRHGYIHAAAPNLLGARVLLEFPSVGATENLLMASVRAKGTTVIDNAAREPEIADLCELLNKMGARIEGSGTSTLTIDGVEELHSADHTVIPDRIEAATYLAALGIAGGEVTVAGARHAHMVMLCQKLGEMGMRISPDAEGIWAFAGKRLRSSDCSTLPYPGLATDFKPFLVALLATADGVGIVTENLFSGRFRYVDELRRMGADIRTDSHHAVVRGVERLSGAPVKSHDIRAGAALVIAGLAAEGETIVSEAHHVARGYDDIAGKLRGIGADVRLE